MTLACGRPSHRTGPRRRLGSLSLDTSTRDLAADKAATLLRGIRPITATDSCRRDLARDMIADLRHLDRRLHTNQAQIRQVLTETHSTIAVGSRKESDSAGRLGHAWPGSGRAASG